MTNKERAKECCEQLYYDVGGLCHGGEPMAHEDNLAVIERALDEKDAQYEELKQKYFENGYIKGQREMRERAANHFSFCVEQMRKWVEDNYPSAVITVDGYQRPRSLVSALVRSIEEIRALPIQGETLDCKQPIDEE